MEHLNFDEFVKKAPISLDEAWNIYINYYEKKIIIITILYFRWSLYFYR